jgi:mannose-6-phosphate isomerase-like protein (cupin superfamily)
MHHIVEEIRYCLSCLGQVWRRLEAVEKIVNFHSGTCLTIPAGTHFQFRNSGRPPLCILIATLPPRPGQK